jgi:predicted MFS family arabinose efflux permease
MGGNFAIGSGVMVVTGAMNDIVGSLQVSVALGGQLVTVGALTVGLGAPLLAAWVSGGDRRRLLTFWMAWYGVGHLLSALMPGYTWLAVLRAATLLGAAVFTPQAAAAIGAMSPPAERGRGIAFVFIGWSIASVLGMPLHAYVAETAGWRSAFALVGLISLAAAWAVWRALPSGLQSAALTRRDWRAALTHPVLMAIVLVTALSGAGQFTLFAYLAPYYRQVLQASPGQISLLFFAFGVGGVLGNALLARHLDRVGTERAVALLLLAMALSLVAWPLGAGLVSMMLVFAPWAFACFASNSAQQARLGAAAPVLAPALLALNSSAIYVGQALGAASGGAIMARWGFGPLHWAALAWMLLALALSLWAWRRGVGDVHHGRP